MRFRFKSLPVWVWILGVFILLLVLIRLITHLLVFFITAAAIVFLTVFANLTVQNYQKTGDWRKALEKTFEDLSKLAETLFKLRF